MSKIRFAIIGNGYRAMAYLRVGLALPEDFEVTSVLFRNQEKATAFSNTYSIPVALSLNDCLATKPDFVIIAIGREAIPAMMHELMTLGMPMLVETPPAVMYEDLLTLWQKSQEFNAKIQVAEQYFLHPLYQAKLKALSQGILGDLTNLSISWAHDYHGVSLIRKLLGVNFETAKIYGKNYQFPVTVTDSRIGIKTNGDVVTANRARYTFEFANGKVAYYDFASDIQYRSKIRTRHLNIQGIRGEMDDLTVRSLTSDNQPILQNFQVTEDINTLTTYSVNLGNECLYTNPLVHARLTDDEIAIANCLIGMQNYILTDKDFYSFAEGCQDTYFWLLMQEALQKPNITIQSKQQPWNS
ncbi:MAG: oxidoreductase domain protein [Herbinix sp.]|jgi:hypothetical protein|nr:oxidoreductase domain protein [Herbinix sp.]